MYAKDIKEINEKLGIVSPKACVVTYGCQMNARDSEKLSGMLLEMGYEITKEPTEADLVVFNTCCVRENAENKLYGNLGNLKERKQKDPNFKVVLCGCMMQQDIVVEKIKQSFSHIDIIFGTHNIARFPELLHSHLETGDLIIDIWQDAKEIVEDLPSKREYPFKAGVNIMYGCNNFCSFCIVPFVRGRERSRRPGDIIAEISNLVADGVSEVMLLGQNVNSYKHEDVGFVELLHMVHDIEGLRRIRFMSSHPKDISDGVIEAFRDLPKMCKQLHLPFQAGSSRILEMMNRKHTKEWYLDLVEKVRAAVPDITFTTDIMVGFPGETEEDFLDTIDVVRRGRFTSAFTFIYSPRFGTIAAKAEDQVNEATTKDRFNRLVKEVNGISLDIAEGKVGNTFEVMVEGANKDGTPNGRTCGGSLVHINGATLDTSPVGSYINVKIMEAKTFYLIGEIENEQ